MIMAGAAVVFVPIVLGYVTPSGLTRYLLSASRVEDIPEKSPGLDPRRSVLETA